MIDRRALVDRHAVEVSGIEAESPLAVGNGELCFTVDVTGLQTFPASYPVAEPSGGPAGTLLGTQSQWGWHSSPGAERHDLEQARRSYATPRGPVLYVDMAGAPDSAEESATEASLRANPHRLDLARIGLTLDRGDGAPQPPAAHQLHDVHQRLDLWTGIIDSRFRLGHAAVHATTVCHPERDVLGVRVTSDDVAAGRLSVRFAFPYASESWNNAADWTRPDAHRSSVRPFDGGCWVRRELDSAVYTVRIGIASGARVAHTGAHELILSSSRRTLEAVIEFLPGDQPSGEGDGERFLPTFTDVVSASQGHWPRFWTSGAAVELADSADERAFELERRTVLSQFLTAIHCAGSLPPQETGLMVNSWRGKFHLEMHWWHAAHFPLWGRPALLERSLEWYPRVLERARETARLQGYAGARWPKQVGPEGRESPSPIAPFLVWQQPHLIYLAELVRRATGSDQVVQKYGECVMDTAAFMASFVVPTERGFELGPPLIPAQESYASIRGRVWNPTFELGYWAWGLTIAQQWRARLDLEPESAWSQVAGGLVPPRVRGGTYAAIDAPPYTVRNDHPSMLYALGVVPPTDLIDADIMRATLQDVLSDWEWDTTWGWDYPAIAMTAARLGQPDTAVAALFMDTDKNTYLRNGHNRQSPRLPAYLPGNGGLLAAIALMAGGWEEDNVLAAPGFPPDGSWTVRHEGLQRSP